MLCTRRVVVPKDASVSGDPSYSLAFSANCSGRRDHHRLVQSRESEVGAQSRHLPEQNGMLR
jgi:hypothetical protein